MIKIVTIGSEEVLACFTHWQWHYIDNAILVANQVYPMHLYVFTISGENISHIFLVKENIFLMYIKISVKTYDRNLKY